MYVRVIIRDVARLNRRRAVRRGMGGGSFGGNGGCCGSARASVEE